MAYGSDESRDFQIYVSSFPGKEGKFQISTAGGSQAFWSRDGKELFYYSPERVLMAVQVIGGPRFEHLPPQPMFQTRVITSSLPAISPDGKRFLMPSLLEGSGDTPDSGDDELALGCKAVAYAPTSARTRQGLPDPFTILSGGVIRIAPLGGIDRDW